MIFAGLVCSYLVKFVIPTTNISLKSNNSFQRSGYFSHFVVEKTKTKKLSIVHWRQNSNPSPSDSQAHVQSGMLAVCTLSKRNFMCTRETDLPPNFHPPDLLMYRKVIFSRSIT